MEFKMHTNRFYVEMMPKERHQQFLADAEILRFIKIAPSTRIQSKKKKYCQDSYPGLLRALEQLYSGNVSQWLVDAHRTRKTIRGNATFYSNMNSH